MGQAFLKLGKALALGVAATVLAAAAYAAVSLVTLWVWVAKDLPPPRDLLSMPLQRCFDGTDAQRSNLADLPAYVADAYVAAEDGEFRQSDLIPTFQVLARLFSGTHSHPILSVQLGAQQIWFSFPRQHERYTINRLRTMVQADRMTLALTKDEILTAALDTTYYGRGERNLHCAARTWLGKLPQQIDLADAALLAGLIRSPSFYDPRRSLERAAKRRNEIIQAMRKAGMVTEDEARTSMAAPLRFLP